MIVSNEIRLIRTTLTVCHSRTCENRRRKIRDGDERCPETLFGLGSKTREYESSSRPTE